MLNTIATYRLPADYIKQEESFLKGLTVDKEMNFVIKYIDPSKMYYVEILEDK